MAMTQRILIVDDEFGLADVVGKILRDHGYDVSIAINGEMGLAHVQENIPDLILLDVMMPIIDGVAMLKTLRDNPLWEHIPVVMMTGPVELVSSEGPPLHQGVLRRPFGSAALLSMVRQLIAQRESQH